MFRNNNNRRDASGNIDASNNIFEPAKNSIRTADLNSSWFVTDNNLNPSTKGADLNLHRFNNNNRSNYNNRYYNEAPPPQNIFRQGDNRRDYRSYNDNRNMFNNNRPAPVVKEPEVKPFPPMDDFPALGLSSKTKVAAAVQLPPVKSFAKIAEDASTIVVPKLAIKKLANNETASSVAHKPYIPSGKRRMTLNEFMERREDGQQIDMDDVSICSEYSNNIIDDSDNDDDDEY
jgi:hypothetical protein